MEDAAYGISEARGIGCVISADAYAALVAVARRQGRKPAQVARSLIEAGLDKAPAAAPPADVSRLGADLSSARQAEAQLRVTLAARYREIARLMDTASERSQTEESATNRAQAKLIADLKTERDDARAEAFRWRRSAEEAGRARAETADRLETIAQENERLEGELGELRRAFHVAEGLITRLRFATAEADRRAEGLAPPAPPAPAPAKPRDMVDRGRDEAPRSDSDDLTPAFVKSVVGFHSVGQRPADIARLMRCDIAAVRRALERRR